MTLAAPAECARTALTHAQIDFERFANPFCDKQREVKARGKHGPYCSAPCGMDGYALRRARALLKKVGIIRFHQLLTHYFCRATFGRVATIKHITRPPTQMDMIARSRLPAPDSCSDTKRA
jgi:hypothetical protein